MPIPPAIRRCRAAGASSAQLVRCTRDPDDVPYPNAVVQITRAAAALAFAQHRDAIAPPLDGIVAQRVLPQQLAEPQVDVGAGREPRQIATARIDEFVPVDGLGERCDRTDAQLHGLGLPELFERCQAFCTLLAG